MLNISYHTRAAANGNIFGQDPEGNAKKIKRVYLLRNLCKCQTVEYLEN